MEVDFEADAAILDRIGDLDRPRPDPADGLPDPQNSKILVFDSF